jgi:hypothetical protein
MHRPRLSLRFAAAAGLFIATACSDGTPPTGPAARGPSLLGAVQAPDAGSLDRAIPGFGGFFLRNGVPTVYLTDVTQRRPVELALGTFARARGFAPEQIRVIKADYAYRDLDRWFRQVSYEAFDAAAVVYADLDEATNRVAIAVEPGTAKDGIRSLAARLGIPAGAVVVREAAPIVPMATLRDLVRPVVAGLQINFGQFVCSVGFNATSGGTASFVTASHCTKRQGGVEGTQYFQPLASVANSFIATEVADPTYFRNANGCPKGKKCRFSDASRAAYGAGVANTLGGIAQTSGANNGSLTITGTFSVTGETDGVVGDVANKVGRTTGWTQGTITATNVLTGVSGSNIALIDQTFVESNAVIVGGGDSGSGVFRLAGGSSVTLMGILWGGSGDGRLFVYSPISNVEQELGALTTN